MGNNCLGRIAGHTIVDERRQLETKREKEDEWSVKEG